MTSQTAAWRNPRIVLTLLIVFLCGASAGMLGMALGQHRVARASQQPLWKEPNKEISLEHFKKELDLSPAQTQQLETILDDFFTYYHTLQAQLDDVRASGKQRIMRVLDENQKRKFEKMLADSQDRQVQLH
jgi:hypothetical protein